MFTVDSDSKWRCKNNSVVGIHAQQGNVMIGRQPSDHILRNAMNNNVVNLSQQMCSPLANLWSLNNLHFSFYFAPLPSFFPLSCPFSLSSSLSPFHSLSSSSRVWQTLGVTWEGQFVLSTLRSPFELGETTMTCAMLERTPTITPSLRWWGTGLSETFSRFV